MKRTVFCLLLSSCVLAASEPRSRDLDKIRVGLVGMLGKLDAPLGEVRVAVTNQEVRITRKAREIQLKRRLADNRPTGEIETIEGPQPDGFVISIVLFYDGYQGAIYRPPTPWFERSWNKYLDADIYGSYSRTDTTAGGRTIILGFKVIFGKETDLKALQRIYEEVRDQAVKALQSTK